MDHELRAELPARTSSSTKRTSPGATRRRRRDASRLRLRPWIALVVLKDTGDPATSEFQRRQGRGRPAAAVHRGQGLRRLPAGRPSSGPGRTCTSTGTWARRADELVAARRARRRRPAGGGARRQSRHRLLAHRLPAAARGEHAPITRSWCRPSSAAGWPGSASIPTSAPFATASAWADYAGRPEPLNMPYYHRWYFRTGGVGDFETLVRLLKWKTADPRVGRRDMDVQEPGLEHPRHPRPGPARHPPARRRAARAAHHAEPGEASPSSTSTRTGRRRPTRTRSRQKLARFINLADDFTANARPTQARTDAGMPPDRPGRRRPADHLADLRRVAGAAAPAADRPRTAPPLDPQRQLDPRAQPRPAPSRGRRLRRRRRPQEPGRLHGGRLAAGRRRAGAQPEGPRRADLARRHRCGPRQGARRRSPPTPTRLLAARPRRVQARVARPTASPSAIARQQSVTPTALTSPTMRRIARPGGPLARRLGSGRRAARERDARGGQRRRDHRGAAEDDARRASPRSRTIADAAPMRADLAAGVARRSARAVRRGSAGPAAARRAGPARAGVRCRRTGLLLGDRRRAGAWRGRRVLELARRAADARRGARRRPRQACSRSTICGPGPDFVFGDAADPATGGARRPLCAGQRGGARFKVALRDWARVRRGRRGRRPRDAARARSISRARPPRSSQAVRPARTIPRRFLASATIAPHVRGQIVEVFDEIKYYPRIDVPMYRPLKELGDELFVPNLNLIERDSVVALETNQNFIEAYMVGVNHEFSRELLWREYPTDQRGTYFRQFWDVAVSLRPDADRTPTRCARSSTTSRRSTAGRATLGARRARQPPARSRRGAQRDRARHPRRAAEEVPDHGRLRARRASGR